MYSVYDLINGCCVKTGSMLDVAYWWRKKMKVDFSQLNITGKDTRTVLEKDGWLRIQENERDYVIPTYKRVTRLRQYQVLDDCNRSIDIRNWPKSVWEYSPTYPPAYWLCGCKDHSRRSSGPSMWRRTYRAALDGVDDAELYEEGLPCPIHDNTDIRLPFGETNDVWSYYDRHRYHRKSKSWKDQTKARKQWAKHKNCGGKREDKWAGLDQELTMFLTEGPDSPSDTNSFSEEAA